MCCYTTLWNVNVTNNWKQDFCNKQHILKVRHPAARRTHVKTVGYHIQLLQTITDTINTMFPVVNFLKYVTEICFQLLHYYFADWFIFVIFNVLMDRQKSVCCVSSVILFVILCVLRPAHVFTTVYVSHKFIYLRKITLSTYELQHIFRYFLYTTVHISEVFLYKATNKQS